MPQVVFELSCVVIVFATLWAMARYRPRRELLLEYLSLAVAGWVAEETCILAYRFYSYAEVWTVRAHLLPVLVPLIWPLVIVSARDVVKGLWPVNGWRQHVLVGAVVAFDASLVEVVAVRAGLWSWSEPGHLNVPVIGMLGWGYFAVGASVALSWASRWRYLAVLPLGLTSTHGLIVATWWGLFRWVARGDLGVASTVGVIVIGLVAGAFVLATKCKMPMRVAAPRMLAAALFLVLLLTTAAGEWAYWVHVVAVSVPYSVATALGRDRCAADVVT